jgi:hypothetical protein
MTVLPPHLLQRSAEYWDTVSAAQECDLKQLESKEYAQRYTLPNTQEQITNVLRNCTIIDGTLIVAPDYRGTLELNGIKNITANLRIADAADLTGFTAVDLLYARQIYLRSLPAISVDFPEVQRVGSVNLDAQTQKLQLNLPKLETANDVVLSGTLDRYVKWRSPNDYLYGSQDWHRKLTSAPPAQLLNFHHQQGAKWDGDSLRQSQLGYYSLHVDFAIIGIR